MHVVQKNKTKQNHTEKSERRTKKAKEDFMFSSQIKQILLKLFDCMEVACILIIYRQRTRRERENINKKARD
jgi:phosphosulfolactate phosphohydrolase-like enzyme